MFNHADVASAESAQRRVRIAQSLRERKAEQEQADKLSRASQSVYIWFYALLYARRCCGLAGRACDARGVLCARRFCALPMVAGTVGRVVGDSRSGCAGGLTCGDRSEEGEDGGAVHRESEPWRQLLQALPSRTARSEACGDSHCGPGQCLERTLKASQCCYPARSSRRCPGLARHAHTARPFAARPDKTSASPLPGDNVDNKDT